MKQIKWNKSESALCSLLRYDCIKALHFSFSMLGCERNCELIVRTNFSFCLFIARAIDVETYTKLFCNIHNNEVSRRNFPNPILRTKFRNHIKFVN